MKNVLLLIFVFISVVLRSW